MIFAFFYPNFLCFLRLAKTQVVKFYNPYSIFKIWTLFYRYFALNYCFYPPYPSKFWVSIVKIHLRLSIIVFFGDIFFITHTFVTFVSQIRMKLFISCTTSAVSGSFFEYSYDQYSSHLCLKTFFYFSVTLKFHVALEMGRRWSLRHKSTTQYNNSLISEMIFKILVLLS